MDITIQEFLEYMSTYNQKIYPMQYGAYLLGAIVIVLILKPSRLSNRIISGILAFFCLWVAFIYGLPFALAGELFGIVSTIIFALQGLFFISQVVHPKLIFGFYSRSFTIIGFVFILYALVGYPILNWLLGHTYPKSLPFGLAPCPVVVFLFGILMLTQKRVPKLLLFFPFLYSVTGFFPISMGILEDVGLLLSGLICAPLILRRDHRLPKNID